MQVGRELGEPPLGVGAGGEHPLQFVLELAAGPGQPLQFVRRRRLGGPQGRQCCFGGLAGVLLGERALGIFGDLTFSSAKLGGVAFGLSFGRAPAGVEQQRFGAPDVLAEPTIALRLACLFPQGLELGLDRRDHVVEPQQIVFGSLEPQFGLVAARMQPGGAGSLFEEKPAFGGLGVDQRAHSPLADHRPGMGAARGVGEQQLNVARPHLAPVDPVDRAGAALDAAHDLDLLTVIEGERGVT